MPSLERVTAYARDHIESRGDFPASTQSLPLYDGPQVLYRPTSEEGAWIEIPFEVKEQEPLRLLLNMTTSYDFGKYQAYLIPAVGSRAVAPFAGAGGAAPSVAGGVRSGSGLSGLVRVGSGLFGGSEVRGFGGLRQVWTHIHQSSFLTHY